MAAWALALVAICAQARAESPQAAAWSDPPVFRSHDGELIARLEAIPRSIKLGDTPFEAMTYNGAYPGPTLRVKPGDVMHVTLVNHLREPTNLHFHGIQTSPLGNSDNIMVVVPPDGSFQYDVRIPPDQPPGLYWYHAHIHGLATKQVTGGLAGALVVEGLEQDLPVPREVTERLFVLKDNASDDGDSDDPDQPDIIQTINGLTRVSLSTRSGETQFWRFSNQSANLYFHLKVQGHRFRIVAEDGVRLRAARETETLDLGPGTRLEALIDGGAPGDYEIISDKVLTAGMLFRSLGVLHVQPGPVREQVAAASPWQLEDLRGRAVTERRAIVFTQDDATETYRINGRLFSHDRIDTRVPLGSTEEWTVRNDTDDMHVFHIHQLSFQVVAINGQPQPFNGYLDVVRVPERGEVTLLLPFTRRETLGRFVYHCHVLKHEDKGMMAIIEVYDPAAPAPRSGWLDRPWRWLRQQVFAWRTGLPAALCAL